MDSGPAEMMETDSGLQHRNTAVEAAVAGRTDFAFRELPTMCRRLIDQGRPSQALQAVIAAVRARGGEEAVFQSLQRARELYLQKVKAEFAADQLASLFAECAIVEAQPLKSQELSSSSHGMVGLSASLEIHESSILAETGRQQIVLDASSDGSSFICLQCGGLVSNHRKDEHFAYWCHRI